MCLSLSRTLLTSSTSTLAASALIGLCIWLGGCRSQPANLAPSIEFSKVPVADIGGPDKLGIIEGRAIGARPGQHIALYALSEGIWWVQPEEGHPLTTIEANSRWKNSTHLGTQYAALLVDTGYKPPNQTEFLPTQGTGGVSAVATIRGEGPAPAAIPQKVLQFSGYEWVVRNGFVDRAGTRHLFDPANAWTDANGALHLRITRKQGQWTCAEVRLTRSFGYGSYKFVVRDVSHLEPAAVLTLFTWNGLQTDQSRPELDVEISRWGYPEIQNAQYVVQPYFIPTNVARFSAPSGLLTYTYRWQPGRVTFQTVRGTNSKSPLVSEHVFTSGVPVPTNESVRMNLYVFEKAETPPQKEAEVVIDRFEYFP